MDIDALQECIHHRFAQVKFLETALTHSSFANEQDCREDNERLEFLGDAVLELCISEEGFKRYPTAPEGQLTSIRSQLVKEASLAVMARGLGLDRHIRLGRGEELQGGRERDALLADAFEALLGAVFLDGGFEAARQTILCLFEEQWPVRAMLPETKDYKSRLQEVAQEMFRDRPLYVLAGTSGPEHEKIFEVDVTLPEGELFRGSGTSVKRAEQEAARIALDFLES
ncbi:MULTISPECIES: ribonuclease III [unclassified Pseudodesulfovibrio]|uniref:ribonuclease III n=1 Tax=unclassified Pseudodesulfovibrio TaxID=2661612 RepID=UPI000FEC03B4|nr:MULTISPECIES: ribonuclease III [unclassified Pseudodesulfovibrio]MCJ2166303.1 ribonuclease III [Pseudodesulfovibrio sp. S3-i]RWU02253.1 ribonuclease III [Pseudodesulfovibrio sp. S3]